MIINHFESIHIYSNFDNLNTFFESIILKNFADRKLGAHVDTILQNKLVVLSLIKLSSNFAIVARNTTF